MKIDRNKIHRDSEIWQYDGKIEFTQELVDFFEEERKKIERQKKNDSRHLSLEDVNSDTLYSSIFCKDKSIEEKAEISQELKKLNDFLSTLTDKQRTRYSLHKLFNMSFSEIAKLEKTNKKVCGNRLNKWKKK